MPSCSASEVKREGESKFKASSPSNPLNLLLLSHLFTRQKNTWRGRQSSTSIMLALNKYVIPDCVLARLPSQRTLLHPALRKAIPTYAALLKTLIARATPPWFILRPWEQVLHLSHRDELHLAAKRALKSDFGFVLWISDLIQKSMLQSEAATQGLIYSATDHTQKHNLQIKYKKLRYWSVRIRLQLCLLPTMFLPLTNNIWSRDWSLY